MNRVRVSQPFQAFCRQSACIFHALIAFVTVCASVATSRAATEHVIAISVDGLRGDFLQSFIETAPQEFPNFVRLRNSSAYTYQARCDYHYSVTNPNHISMLTGRPVAQSIGLTNEWHHGITDNGDLSTVVLHQIGNLAIPYKASVFDVVHDHGLSTALYLSKSKMATFDRSYNAVNGAPDEIGPDNGRDKINFSLINNGNTPALIHTLTQHIRGRLEEFTFLHIHEPDSAGHNYGWIAEPGSAYRQSIRQVDAYLGAIYQALDERPDPAAGVAILLTADHGGSGHGHGNQMDPAHYTIPFFISASEVPANTNLYSVLGNRFDPGIAQVPYTSSTPPVRNGDLANFATALLELPPVPGSLMKPKFKKITAEPLVPTLRITAARGRVVVTWPNNFSGWSLETTDSFPNGSWKRITSGIMKTRKSYSYVAGMRGPHRFFRLHKATAP